MQRKGEAGAEWKKSRPVGGFEWTMGAKVLRGGGSDSSTKPPSLMLFARALWESGRPDWSTDRWCTALNGKQGHDSSSRLMLDV